MLRIIGLLTALVIIIATLSVGTFAYFNDVTTISGNTITAGTLTLTVGTGAGDTFTISDVFPTANGTAKTWAISNGGTINGTLEIDVSAIINNENIRSALETSSGDTTSGATEGDLGERLKIAMWLSTNNDANIDNGEVSMNATSGTAVTWAGGTVAVSYANTPSIFYTVDSFGSDNFTGVKTNFAGSAGTLYVIYHFPNDLTQTFAPYYDDNRAQSDGVSANMTFSLVQSQ